MKINKIKSLPNLKIINLTEFAKWWKKREKKSFSLDFFNNKLKINTNNKDKDVYLRIITPKDEEIRVPLRDCTLRLDKLHKKSMLIFKERNIRKIDILKSKISFSIFYLGVLFKSIKRRVYNIFPRL